MTCGIVVPDDTIAERSRIGAHAAELGTFGYVVDAVPLFCAQGMASQPLEQVLASTIALGGDTDTIASVSGQLAGTVVGATVFPRNHIEAINVRLWPSKRDSPIVFRVDITKTQLVRRFEILRIRL